MVFEHEIDPSMGNEEHQKELGKIHGGTLSEVGDDPDYFVPQIHGFNPSGFDGLIKC
jgi:hypothetical protein